MNSQHMGKLILKLRKEKGMTQKDLAAKLQITDNAVSKWERGKGCPDISILPELSEILGISVDELLSDKPTVDRWQAFKELNAGDVREIVGLLCRCVSLALAAGGLVIYLVGKLTLSDFCVMLCAAIILLGIESLNR